LQAIVDSATTFLHQDLVFFCMLLSFVGIFGSIIIRVLHKVGSSLA